MAADVADADIIIFQKNDVSTFHLLTGWIQDWAQTGQLFWPI
jgi:hypothetical protein